MSYLESLDRDASIARTLNGAKTYSGSGDACLDFFAVAGGMRYRKKQDQIILFDRAYIENPELAMKLLFHIRDIRGGMGEREMFRTLLHHVALSWPESARKNVRYIAEFGRYDDLLCLFDTPAETETVAVIREQLQRDRLALEERRNGNADARISLLAKWLPSCNTSSYRTRRKAVKVMKALGMDQKSYRKMLSALRANTCITERYLSRREPEKITYHAVPAGTMFKYRKAFERRDAERYEGYLRHVEQGKETIHSGTLFPYELLRPFFNRGWFIEGSQQDGNRVLDVLWAHLGAEVKQDNAISVVDTSGSMYCAWNGGPMPALFSQALGLYLAEHCTGPFHNLVITFESKPHLMKVPGGTLPEKLRYMQSLPWGGSTDLEAVFMLILNAAVDSGASQEEMPGTIYIFSDMEFNQAVRDSKSTVFESAKAMFEEFGYQLPAVVFHNVNSWQMQVPVRKNTRGAALVSGQSTANFSHPTSVNTTPMGHMLQILNSRRYRMIHA